jgi:hypothetical protein
MGNKSVPNGSVKIVLVSEFYDKPKCRKSHSYGSALEMGNPGEREVKQCAQSS